MSQKGNDLFSSLIIVVIILREQMVGVGEKRHFSLPTSMLAGRNGIMQRKLGLAVSLGVLVVIFSNTRSVWVSRVKQKTCKH